MHIADGCGIAPACNRTFAAVLCKLFLCKNISCRLIEIDLAVRKLGQVDKAVLQAEQLQIAGRAVECISAVAGVHADGHIIVAVLVGNIHRKDGLAGFKVENDVLPHTRGQILHIAVDIARCGGELHDRGVAQIVSGPDALHLVAAVGFHGVHALDAGGDHGIALHQPVLVINVGVALDRRIVVGVGKACVARAEPVADNRADRACAVIVDDCRVLDCHLIAIRQIIKHRRFCHDLTGFHIERKKIHGVCIVGEHHKVRRQRRRAAAAPRKTAAGGLVAFTADLRADALIRRTPDSLDTVVGAQQIAILIGQNDRAVLGGGNAVLRALAGRQLVDENRLRQVGLLTVEDRFDCRVGDIAENALLLALGIDAEAAGGEPEVPVVVKYHGKKILRQLLAERGLCRRLDVDVKHLFKLGKDIALLVRCAEHQYMVVAGRADDTVFSVQEGVGALDQVAAAVMLLRGKITERLCLLRIQIADGDAAEQRNDCMAVAVKVNGGRRIRVCRLIGDMDLRIDAERQDLVG